MPATLTTPAVERSTYVISASFTDEAGVAATPTSLEWTLTDDYGTVINNRQDVALTPAEAVDIVLSGDDLAITEASATVARKVTIRATYNSTYGIGLPWVDQCLFTITNLAGV